MGISTGQTVDVPVSNPTLASAKRAMTTSFGSNCYGSLLIAIIQTLKSIANNAKNQAGENGNAGMAILFCCLQCILSIIEDILEYFNKVFQTYKVCVCAGCNLRQRLLHRCKRYMAALQDPWNRRAHQ
jgi:Plasma-membrane choline transporter